MGSDNLVQIARWRRWRDIFRAVPIAVVSRPGSAMLARTSKAAILFRAAQGAPGKVLSARLPAWTLLEAKRNPVSATGLRMPAPSRM
jgi:nicotinate-nucleotide adenylyltransferase